MLLFNRNIFQLVITACFIQQCTKNIPFLEEKVARLASQQTLTVDSLADIAAKVVWLGTGELVMHTLYYLM